MTRLFAPEERRQGPAASSAAPLLAPAGSHREAHGPPAPSLLVTLAERHPDLRVTLPSTPAGSFMEAGATTVAPGLLGPGGRETVRVTDACTACGACLATCPERALRRAPKRPAVVDSACTACWACIEICPAGAIVGATNG